MHSVNWDNCDPICDPFPDLTHKYLMLQHLHGFVNVVARSNDRVLRANAASIHGYQNFQFCCSRKPATFVQCTPKYSQTLGIFAASGF